MKKLVKIAAAVVAMLVLVLGGVLIFIDSIARGAIEKGATHALGLQTTLDSADVGILSGRFAMSGLTVANPEGFRSDHFLQLGGGAVDVTLGSLREEVVELPVLSLSAIDLRIEKNASGSNYQVIVDNLKKTSSGDTGDEVPSAKRFVIHEVVVTDVNVQADLSPVGGSLTSVRVPIDEIRLTDVGSGSGDKRGVKLSELASVLVEALLAAVVANAADFPAELAADLDRLGPQLQRMLGENIQRQIDDALGDEIGGIGEEIGKALDDLFGGK